jgi:hypothetical protein
VEQATSLELVTEAEDASMGEQRGLPWSGRGGEGWNVILIMLDTLRADRRASGYDRVQSQQTRWRAFRFAQPLFNPWIQPRLIAL